MKCIDTALPGVVIVEPQVFGDDRGFFLETYHQARYREAGIDCRFVQDNLSLSVRGTLRGLHYQINHPQDKLVQVITGEVFDVVVDLRPDSDTFRQWTGVRLSSESKRQLFVPKGFAHGFCVLSEEVHFFYKCSDIYRAEDEGGVIWNDPDLGIQWPVKDPVISAKDQQLPRLVDAVLPSATVAPAR
jgi:dTDP-4-dehydrorhamnose 3,5-epimerase